MFEHIFQISEFVLSVLKLNELSCGREVCPRSKVVCDPELGKHKKRRQVWKGGMRERWVVFDRLLYIFFLAFGAWTIGS